jgi:hypothetical protein
MQAMQRPSPDTPTRRRSRWPRVLLIGLIVLAIAFVFRQGLVPWYLNPLPAIDLARPCPWLADWRLAAMRNNPDLCRSVLVAPHTDARPIPDSPMRDGCGWTNAVRMSQAGGVRAGFDKLTCESATALTLWLKHDLQDVAQSILGQRVVEVKDFGTYSCRDIIGRPTTSTGVLLNQVRNKLGIGRRSQHATGNAVDIGGFVLADGRQITVRGQWRGNGPEARFLRAAHSSACRYFRVALSPDYNAEHHDHFHLDRGAGWICW